MDQKQASALTYIIRKQLWPKYILPVLSRDERVKRIRKLLMTSWEKEAEMSNTDGLELLRKVAGVNPPADGSAQSKDDEFWTKVAARLEKRLGEQQVKTADFIKAASEGYLHFLDAIEGDLKKTASQDPILKEAGAWAETMRKFFRGLSNQAGQANSFRDFLRGTYRGILRNTPTQYQPLVEQAARIYKNPYVRGGAGTLAGYKLLFD